MFPSRKCNKEFLLWCNRISSISAMPRILVQFSAQHRGLKDPALSQLWHRSQLWLRSDPWPRNSICSGAAKKGGKKRKNEKKKKGNAINSQITSVTPSSLTAILSSICSFPINLMPTTCADLLRVVPLILTH